jgi:hypothetical protein
MPKGISDTVGCTTSSVTLLVHVTHGLQVGQSVQIKSQKNGKIKPEEYKMRSYGTSVAPPGRSLNIGWTFPTEEKFKSKPQFYINQFAYDSAAIPATMSLSVDYTKHDKKALQEEVARLRDLQLRQGRVLSSIQGRLDRTGGLVADQNEVDQMRLTLANAKKTVDFISSRTNALLVGAENELAKRNQNKILLIAVPIVLLIGIGLYQSRQ